MIIEVHVAFLIAALSVLVGITYTLGMFLDRQTKSMIEKRKSSNTESPTQALKA